MNMQNIIRLLLTDDFNVTVKKQHITIENEFMEATIKNDESRSFELAHNLKIEIENMGFELKEHIDKTETVYWYERVLVPGSQRCEPIVLCFTIEKQEFYFENFPGIRFKDAERAKVICKAFAGLKNEG